MNRQLSFFDQDPVLPELDKLLNIDEFVNWEGFRLTLEDIRPQCDMAYSIKRLNHLRCV